jgi:hypothetical protein
MRTGGLTVSFETTNFSLCLGWEGVFEVPGASRRMTGNVDWYWAWLVVSDLFIESWVADKPATVSAGAWTFVESPWFESRRAFGVTERFFEESAGTIWSFARAAGPNKHIAKKQTS